MQVSGTYNNGNIILDEAPAIDKVVKVTVLFDEKYVSPNKERLSLNDFSFLKSRELLKEVKGCISDAVIEQRRN